MRANLGTAVLLVVTGWALLTEHPLLALGTSVLALLSLLPACNGSERK